MQTVACVFILLSHVVFGHFIKTQNVQRGIYNTVLAYDYRHLAKDVNYVYTYGNNNTLYIVAISNGVANKVVCRETISTPIIVYPKGCDNRDESKSVLRANCGHKTLTGLQSHWFQQKSDDVCIRASSDSTCLGPVYLFSSDKPFDEAKNGPWDLIAGAYLISGSGPSCAIPTITRVDLERPQLVVNSTCSFIPPGVYDVDVQKSQKSYFNFRFNVHAIEIKPNVALRVYTLGRLVYVSNYASMLVDYAIFNASQSNESCNFILDIKTPLDPLKLSEPEVPTYTNFFKNKVRPYYKSMECNWGVSKLRFENKNPILGGIPEGVSFGGKIRKKNKHGIPIYFQPNPTFADFYPDCSRFYPKSDTFNGFGFTGFDGPVYDRFVRASYTCYAPFPFPERIIEIGTLEERAKQCFMLGGVLATRTFDVCSMDSWKTYCRLGWLYFDNRCWYMPNPTLDSLYRVPAGVDSDNACRKLHGFAISAYPITWWVSAWLQRFFIYWQDGDVEIRVNIEGNRCECYTTLGVNSCLCDDPSYPLCSYNVKSDFLTWTLTEYHPETLEVLANGQYGMPHDGSEFTCECEPGWTGKTCTQQTCVPPILATETFNSSIDNPQLAFFKKCYFNQRGYCKDDFVYECQCVTGYGPRADLLNRLYVDTPCTCPALSVESTVEKIISIDTELSPNFVGVCGFLERGRCVTEGWNEASCHCRYRWAKNDRREVAYAGKTCSCRVPQFTSVSEVITQNVCNNHGTCCPHGERDDGKTVACPEKFDGCYCDDGWAGESCTSRVPSSLLLHHPFVLTPNVHQLTRLKTRLAIHYVYLTSPLKNLTSVELVDEIGDGVVHQCTSIEFEDWESQIRETMKFNCDGVKAWYIQTPTYVTNIRATESNYTICGVHVNKKAARFYEMPKFSENENTTQLICALYIPDELQLIRPFEQQNDDVVIQLLQPSTIYYVYVVNASPFTVPKIGNVLCMPYMYESWEVVNLQVSKYFCYGVFAAEIRINATYPEVRVIGHDYQQCAAVKDDVVDEYQQFRFAKYGSTSGACLCAPGFIGIECNIGISAWRLNELDSTWNYHQCGDSTIPKRGEVHENKCQCNAIGTDVLFSGASCECAIVNGELCSNHGTCETAKFPHGVCDFDANAINQDPLMIPYQRMVFGQSIYVTWNTSTFTHAGDEYTFHAGSTFILQNGYGHLNSCANIPNVLVTFNTHNQPVTTNNNATLNPGTYLVTMNCMFATFIDSSVNINEYGVLDCSNPVDRMMDTLLPQKQCQFPDFFHNLGIGYGLFHNLTPEVDFSSLPWTPEHYKLISSLIGNRRCDDFSTKTWNEYVSGLSSFVTEEMEQLDTTLPVDKHTRMFTFSSDEDIPGLIATTSSGAYCTIYASPIPAFTEINITCLCEDGCNNITYLGPTPSNVLITARFRDVAYNMVFEPLHDAIFTDHTFPEVYTDTCGLNSTAINLSSTVDQLYLENFFNTKLAMRSCSSDAHCQQFVDDSKCIYDNKVAQTTPWLNGDDLADITFGFEGGCECRTDTSGFFNPKTFCSSCVSGYGPDSTFQIRQLERMIVLVPDLIPLGEPISRCSLPIDITSTRPSNVCGGRGRIKTSRRSEQKEIQVIKGTIRRCASILCNSVEYFAIEDDNSYLDIHSYVSKNQQLLHVIHNQVYINASEVYDYTCITLGGALEHTLLSSEEGKTIGLKTRNIFTLWY